MEPGAVPTDTALLVNPGSHPFPAAATKLIVTGIHGASEAVILVRGNHAGMDPHFRRQLRSFHHMGVPPPLTPAPQPRGSAVQAGGGAAGLFLLLIYFNHWLLFLGIERGDKCGAGQAAAAEMKPRLWVPGEGTARFPLLPATPVPGPPDSGGTVATHLSLVVPATDLGTVSALGGSGLGVCPPSFLSPSSLWESHGVP